MYVTLAVPCCSELKVSARAADGSKSNINLDFIGVYENFDSDLNSNVIWRNNNGKAYLSRFGGANFQVNIQLSNA
jgi:hypothetical protein